MFVSTFYLRQREPSGRLTPLLDLMVACSTQRFPSPLLIKYLFHREEYCFFLGVKRQGLDAVYCSLKHTLLFSNFSIVSGEMKRAFSTCGRAFMSSPSLRTNFPLIESRSEASVAGQSARGRLQRRTMRRQQRCCLKSLSRCWTLAFTITVRSLKVRLCNSSHRTPLTAS